MSTKLNNGEKWYFGYGSNMLDDVFITRRKISPLRQEVAVIPTHTLCFNAMGVPYSEPGMGGLRPLDKAQDMPVHGVAYLLAPQDITRVILTEGGGVAYKIQELAATLQCDGSEVTVMTLIARHDVSRSWERLPSKRYMGLLVRGAQEKGLPEEYVKRLIDQPTFEQKSTVRFRVGKILFESIWQRVSWLIQRGVRQFKGEDGSVPPWFLTGFDCLLWTMWCHHDYVHAIIWGRGDGM